MMIIHQKAKRTLKASILCTALLALSACTASAPDSIRADHSHSHEHVSATIGSTVKPGAALDFDSQIDGTLNAGTFTDVIVTIRGVSDHGILEATASGTDGLEVLSSQSELRHDLAKGVAIWRIAVRPIDDRRHYLNIMATTSKDPIMGEAMRSVSIPIDPGTESGRPVTTDKIGTGSDALVIMDADETISPDP